MEGNFKVELYKRYANEDLLVEQFALATNLFSEVVELIALTRFTIYGKPIDYEYVAEENLVKFIFCS